MASLILNYIKSQQENHNSEVKDLLNRLATKEWQSYVQLSQGSSPVGDFPTHSGMSDEEELLRVAANEAELGIGEVLVEIPNGEEFKYLKVD